MMMEIFVVEQVQIQKEEGCELLPLATEQLCKRDLSNTNAQHNDSRKRKITVPWKVKALFCVQMTANASVFYLSLSVQTCFQADIFCLFSNLLKESV